MGDLGRHTKIGPDGMPIVDHIFMQVCYVGVPYQVAKNGWVQISYASAMTTTLTFGLTKLSFLLFYKRYVPPPSNISRNTNEDPQNIFPWPNLHHSPLGHDCNHRNLDSRLSLLEHALVHSILLTLDRPRRQQLSVHR